MVILGEHFCVSVCACVCGVYTCIYVHAQSWEEGDMSAMAHVEVKGQLR